MKFYPILIILILVFNTSPSLATSLQSDGSGGNNITHSGSGGDDSGDDGGMELIEPPDCPTLSAQCDQMIKGCKMVRDAIGELGKLIRDQCDISIWDWWDRGALDVIMSFSAICDDLGESYEGLLDRRTQCIGVRDRVCKAKEIHCPEDVPEL